MTDRELIERAAKAFFGDCYKGEVKWTEYAIGGFWEALTKGQSCDDHLGYQRFDPLHNDGDALRLAVKLNMQITIEDERCSCVTASWGDDYDNHAVEHSETPETAAAATRRAIVRASAAMADNQGKV